MKLFYFTATGNSLHVAKEYGGELYSIPQILKSATRSFENEKIGIVFPCYAGSTPDIVLEFVRKVELISPYIFVIMTYGSTTSGGIAHFVKYAKKHGINIKYANRFLMIDNFLPLLDIEKERAKQKDTANTLQSIVDDVNNTRESIYREYPGSTVMTKFMQTVWKALPNTHSPKLFRVNTDCTGCGICVKVCPRSNIILDNDHDTPQPQFGSTCEFCLACANLCPQQAIKLKRDRNPNARHINENINVKEIITANNCL